MAKYLGVLACAVTHLTTGTRLSNKLPTELILFCYVRLIPSRHPPESVALLWPHVPWPEISSQPILWKER